MPTMNDFLRSTVALMIATSVLIMLSVVFGGFFAVLAVGLNCYNHYRVYNILQQRE